MTFDLVITTYNRPNEVQSLVYQTQQCNPAPINIIVVDSSDEAHPILRNIKGVIYLQSCHKNQPYQRLLGSKASNAEVIVFFDDDLTIINNQIFKALLSEYKNSKVIGATVGIDYRSSIQDNFDSALINNRSNLARLLFKVTGIPKLAPGNASRLGIVGARPNVNQKIDFFYGPCMSFRRNIIHTIINNDLLSIFEKKLGVGEDKAISMMATSLGELRYICKIHLEHPPNVSNYFNDPRTFFKKITYYRIYLSKIFSIVNNKPLWKEKVIFYYFTFWRILIGFSSLLIKPSHFRLQKLLGTFEGLILTFMLPQRAEKLTPSINWQTEILKDLHRAGII